MKKLTRIAVIVLLLVTVCYTGFAQSVGMFDNPLFGLVAEDNRSVLRQGGQGENPISMAGSIRGVIFHETAVPAGNAIGQTVDIQYNPARPDGQRLMLTIGGNAVTTELYDWELIPVARFVESGYTACMTLYDFPQTDEEKETHERNRSKGIMWANFHPDLGNTLIGLNLFFADAMLVNSDLMQFVDKAFTNKIPGYHITGMNLQNMSRKYRIRNTELINQMLNIEVSRRSYNSYIYTDYGTEISYHIENNQIVFNGVPSYLFVYIRDRKKSETITVATEMNERFKSLYRNIVAINPTVYRTAERTAQWAAFFRMVQNEYPAIWQQFMSHVSGIVETPKVATPRYWLPLTSRE